MLSGNLSSTAAVFLQPSRSTYTDENKQFVIFFENVIATKYTLLIIWLTIILIFAMVALKRNRVWPTRRRTYQRAFV